MARILKQIANMITSTRVSKLSSNISIVIGMHPGLSVLTNILEVNANIKAHGSDRIQKLALAYE